jgi:type II secretory pathway component PulF
MRFSAERTSARQKIGLSDREKIRLFRQLLGSIQAGKPIPEFFRIQAGQIASLEKGIDRRAFLLGGKPSDGRFIREMSDLLEDGMPFAAACAQFPKVFDRNALTVIRVGETCGTLASGGRDKDGREKPGALERYVSQLEEISETKAKIRAKLRYAVVLAGFIIAVMLLAFNYVIPQFSGLYESLLGKNDLNAITRSLIGTAEIVRDWWWLMLPALSGGIVLYHKARTAFPAVRETESRVAMRIPLLNRYVVQQAAFNWLGLLITLREAANESANFSIVKCMEYAADSIENLELKAAARRAASLLECNEAPSCHDAMAMAHPCFSPASAIHGFLKEYFETTGMVENLEHYLRELKTDMRLSRDALLDCIDPCVLTVGGGLTLWILLGLYLPLFELIGKMSSR